MTGINGGTVDVWDDGSNKLFSMVVTGVAAINGGYLDVMGLTGTPGQEFLVLQYGPGSSHTATGFTILGDPDGSENPLVWMANYNGAGGLILTASSASSVPIPSTFWLIGAGLAGLIAVRRRKQTTGKLFG
jgi:hypothetical protein